MAAEGDLPAALWAWSVAVYGRPGVAEVCLALQDRHGADVNLCLWAIWLGTIARELDRPVANHALALAVARQSQVTRWLREHRRSLKRELAGEPDSPRRDALVRLHKCIAAAEIAGEQVEQYDLAALVAGCGPCVGHADLSRRNLALVIPAGAEQAAQRLVDVALLGVPDAGT